MPLTPEEEQRVEDLLRQAQSEGEAQGRESAFHRVLRAVANRVLGREATEQVAIVAESIESGIQGMLRRAERYRDEVWTPRWRDELEAPVAAVMDDATEVAAQVLGLDMNHPGMRDYLDGYVSNLAETLSETSYNNFRGVLEESLSEGLSGPLTSRRLQERIPEINATRADLIARNETLRANKGASYEQARRSGLVIAKRRLTAHDARVRPEHARIDGEERPVDEPYSNGEAFSGELSINCRCIDEWIVDFETLGV